MIKVISNGSYDVLTPAHRALLKYARSLGDIGFFVSRKVTGHFLAILNISLSDKYPLL